MKRLRKIANTQFNNCKDIIEFYKSCDEYLEEYIDKIKQFDESDIDIFNLLINYSTYNKSIDRIINQKYIAYTKNIKDAVKSYVITCMGERGFFAYFSDDCFNFDKMADYINEVEGYNAISITPLGYYFVY